MKIEDPITTILNICNNDNDKIYVQIFKLANGCHLKANVFYLTYVGNKIAQLTVDNGNGTAVYSSTNKINGNYILKVLNSKLATISVNFTDGILSF